MHQGFVKKNKAKRDNWSMKKVVYVTTNQDLNPRLELEIKTLLENGYNVKVICWDRRGMHPQEEYINSICFLRIQQGIAKNSDRVGQQSYKTLWGVPGQRGLNMLKKLPLFYIKTLKALMREDFDIIHCCHLVLLPIAVLVGKIRRKKIVYEVSEFYTVQALRELPRFFHFIEKIAIWCEDILVRQIHSVVCVPSRDNIIYQRYSKRNGNVKIVANVPELEDNIDERLYCELKKKYQNYKVIVYAGHIGKSKGVIETIKAVRRVKPDYPNIKLLLIGSCVGDDSELIAEYIKAEKLEDNIELVVIQPYQKLNTFYRIADIGLVLMDKEYGVKLTIGNSRKIIEYMKASLPIIVPDYGGGELIVKEEQCGLVVSMQNEKDIAKALKYLLENPLEAKEMGKKGYNAFKSKYNWNIEKNKFIDLYKNLEISRKCK